MVFGVMIAPPMAKADNIPESFKFEGQYINPACVEQLQTLPSENNGIIIQAVVINTCQGSNLAHHGNSEFSQLVVRESHRDAGVTYVGHSGEPSDPRDDFGYEYLGETSSGAHILAIANTISAYTIRKKRLIYDIDESREVAVLEKVASFGFFPCRETYRPEGEEIILETKRYDGNRDRGSECDGEIAEYNLNKIMNEALSFD